MSEAVRGEVGRAEVCDGLVPVGGVADGGRCEEADARTDELWDLWLSERAESLQDRPDA